MGESLARSPVQTESSETLPYNSSEYKTFIVPLLYLPCFGEWGAKNIYFYYYITILYINQAIKPINNQSENTSE